MKKVCVYYYGGFSTSIANRFIAAKPKYVISDLSAWPSISSTIINSIKAAGITLMAYIPTGGVRGFIWNSEDDTVKTPAGIKSLIDQAAIKGFNGIFFDEGGIYTPVSGQSYQDAFLDRTLKAPGKGASTVKPQIISVVGNSKYNSTTADSWAGLTVEEYISYAKAKGMFICVGCPDQYVRASRIADNIFPIIDAVLTSEEYNGRAPVGQEIPYTSKCWVLSYSGSYSATNTNKAINYGFGAAYCCQSMGSLPSSFETYMAAIPDDTTPPPPVVYTCPTCSQTFSTQALLDAHIASAHPAPVFTCSKCGLTFTSQSALDSHILVAHPVIPPASDDITTNTGSISYVGSVPYTLKINWTKHTYTIT
jgi:hypothetical protein